jgi:PEGA domain-containing protein
MMRMRAWAGALVVTSLAALLGAFPLSAQSTAKQRTPPAPSSGTAQKRKPPSPPGQAVPRPTPPKPRPRPPDRPRPNVPAPHGTYIYPFAPFADFDFVYRFPWGAYPYSRYGYPEYPYRFIFPPPGCVTTELEAHGSVRIDVPQRDASVLVDGFYVGVVDDFNGTLEHLNLTPGPHHIELHAPGFETTVFDVNIEAGRVIVYRTPMRSGGSMPPGGTQP